MFGTLVSYLLYLIFPCMLLIFYETHCLMMVLQLSNSFGRCTSLK